MLLKLQYVMYSAVHTCTRSQTVRNSLSVQYTLVRFRKLFIILIQCSTYLYPFANRSSFSYSAVHSCTLSQTIHRSRTVQYILVPIHKLLYILAHLHKQLHILVRFHTPLRIFAQLLTVECCRLKICRLPHPLLDCFTLKKLYIQQISASKCTRSEAVAYEMS